MRFTTSSLLLAAAATSAVASDLQSCFVENSAELASWTDCGDVNLIGACLAKIADSEISNVQKCYVDAGCSESAAVVEARSALRRCNEVIEDDTELKKRYGGMPMPRAATTDSSSSTGGVMHGASECYTPSYNPTTSCDTTVTNGKTKTGSCSDITATVSKCKEKTICTMDSNDNIMCMKRHDMNVGGTIVLICFVAIFFLGIAALIFMACREKKKLKTLAAKQEAVTLARAATRKARAKQERAPLVRNPSGGNPAGDNNPFQDGNRV